MQHLNLHALVLGSALVVASLILVLRSSSAGREGDARPAPGAGRAQPASVSRTAPAPGAAAREAEEKAYREAQELVQQAAEIYQNSAGKEGTEVKILEAKKMLHEAQELIEQLPREEPRIRDLRNRLTQLSVDLSRVSTF